MIPRGFGFILWALTNSVYAFPARAEVETLINSNTKYEQYLHQSFSKQKTNSLSESLLFEINGYVNDHQNYKLKGLLVWDPMQIDNQDQNEFIIKEAFYQIKNSSWYFLFGFHEVRWGNSDGFNPVDVVNMMNYKNPIQAEKQGAPMIQFSQVGENSSLDLIFIPQQMKSRLPGENSPWLPRHLYLEPNQERTRLILPKNISYHYTDRDEIENSDKNNFGLKWNTAFNSFEGALYFFEGQSSFPILVPEVSGAVIQTAPEQIIQVNSDVNLHVHDYRVRMWGGSATYNWNETLFKLSSSLTSSLCSSSTCQGVSSILPKGKSQSVIGVEKNIGFQNQLLSFLVQYSWISTDEPIDHDSLSFSAVFNNAWSAGFRWSLNENLTVLLYGLVNPKEQSVLNKTSLACSVSEHWKLNLSYSSLDGPNSSVLGIFRDNDLVSLSVEGIF